VFCVLLWLFELIFACVWRLLEEEEGNGFGERWLGRGLSGGWSWMEWSDN
jgi:hypothetical protein